MGIVKASLEILGIGIGVKKVVLLRSAWYKYQANHKIAKKIDYVPYLSQVAVPLHDIV